MIPHALLRRSQTRAARPNPRRRLTRLASALLLPVAASGLVAPAAQVATAAPATAAASPSPWLPFDLPAKATLRASSHKVFANWVTSLPISLDNQPPTTDYYQRNYISPLGEKGVHAAYGGFLRDRPLGRAPIAGDWRMEDMKSEVRHAIASGVDGFTMVVYTLPPAGKTDRLWQNAILMMQAATAVDPAFKIIPMPDTSGGSKLKLVDAATMARRMAELSKYPSAYKVGGKMVLAPFTAENKTPSWWSSVMSTMANTYHAPATLFPLFQDEQKWRTAFAPITYGMMNWGTRNPIWTNLNTTATAPIGRVGKVHALGEKWMAPISVQDSRPRSGIFWESENTQNLRNSWEIARRSGADWAQLATWNDLPEGSGIEPSVKHGYSFLDLNAYYLTWFKTGSQPVIKRDAIYLTHRKHPVAAKPTFKQTKLMKHGGGSPARDTVEALTFAKAPGTVQVTVGGKTTSCAVKVGVNVCTVPLRAGAVSAKLVQGGATTTSLTSPFSVTNTPYVQDMEYVGSSSLRGTNTATTLAPQPKVSTTTLAPAADAYANASAAATKFGSSASLAVNGTPAATSYLRFTLPKAPAGKTLQSATLKVRTSNIPSAGSATAKTVQLADNAWSEAALTWMNRPAVSGATLGSLSAPKANTAYSAPLSAAALRSVLGQQVTVAVTGAGADSLWFWSGNHSSAAYRPQLVLSFG